MYTNKENVNILTALMVAHDIRHVVVCPGSRNAPLVHNFSVCPDILCYPVTDERSAGFYALGLSQALRAPVAVCVTSGTAVLNLFPAVAEASYQHLPLVVLSADRPQAWIEQLDGQTLPQQDIFGEFVEKSVSLPELPEGISSENGEEWMKTQRWYCNRLVNEVLSSVSGKRLSYRPVHINIPLCEPLANFSVQGLPQERVIRFNDVESFDEAAIRQMAEAIRRARRPMIVIGQYPYLTDEDIPILQALEAHTVVLYEALAGPLGGKHFDEVLSHFGEIPSYRPDFLLYGGDTIVSKRLRKFLREGEREVWEITSDGNLHDTFQGIDRVVRGDLRRILCRLADLLTDTSSGNSNKDYLGRWSDALKRQEILCDKVVPSFSQMYVVKCFEEQMRYSGMPENDNAVVHYANSSVIRLANIYSRHPVYCNRGVNGIEGSLSTAAGFSLATDRRVFIVMGDLSFFYDSNALWNESLDGNLRILLLNNGGGGIFHQLPIAKSSPEAISSIAGHHHTSAKGLCESYDILYHGVYDKKHFKDALRRFFSQESTRPVLLEVFTNYEEDATVIREYYRKFTME